MNMNRFYRQMEDAKVAREVVDLAGLDVDTALVTLEAASDKQKNFGGDMRLAAIADIWKYGVEKEYQTEEFAQAIIRAVNRHTNAKWWCDRETCTLALGGFARELDDDIEEEFNA